MGFIPRPAGAGLRLCHSREGGNVGGDVLSGHPPELTPAKAEAGVTGVAIALIPRCLRRGSSLHCPESFLRRGGTGMPYKSVTAYRADDDERGALNRKRKSFKGG